MTRDAEGHGSTEPRRDRPKEGTHAPEESDPRHERRSGVSIDALNAVKHRTVGSRGPKSCLLILADRANDYGVLYGGVDWMARIMECSRDTVMRDLATLESRGLILRIARRRQDGSSKTKITVVLPTGDRGSLEPPTDDEEFGALIAEALAAKSQDATSQDAQAEVASCPEPKSQDPTSQDATQDGQLSVDGHSGPSPNDGDVVDRIVEFWIAETPGRSKARVTDGRRRVVRARLRTFTARQIAVAIREVARQPFYNGKNDASKLYNDLTTTLRNDEKVEGFLDDAERRESGETPGGPSGPQQYSQAAQRRAAEVDGTVDALDRMIEMAESNGGDL